MTAGLVVLVIFALVMDDRAHAVAVLPYLLLLACPPHAPVARTIIEPRADPGRERLNCGALCRWATPRHDQDVDDRQFRGGLVCWTFGTALTFWFRGRSTTDSPALAPERELRRNGLPCNVPEGSGVRAPA